MNLSFAKRRFGLAAILLAATPVTRCASTVLAAASAATLVIAAPALAQTPPAADGAGKPNPGAPQPPVNFPHAMPPAPPPPMGEQGPMPEAGDDEAQGTIIETPHGTFMVTEPLRRMDEMPGHPAEPPGQGMAGMHSMGDMPHPHPGPPAPPSKAARFHLHTADIDIAVKCADDEPVKACVEALSPLVDKVLGSHR